VVDDYPDTTPTDTLLHGTTAGNLTFGFSAFSIPSNATSISVQVLYYDQKTASQAAASAGRLKVGGSYYNATTHNPATSYTSRSDDWATNPKTGAAWTPAQVNGTDGTNDLQAFGFFSNDASPTINFSSVQLQVTYSVAVTLTAETGNFTTAGSTAGFVHTSILLSDRGLYAVVGYSITLLHNMFLSASAGSYSIVGSTSDANKGLLLTGSTGLVTINSQEVAVRSTKLIAADSRVFEATGIDASLERSIGLVAEKTTYSIIGQAATVRYVTAVTFDTGSFAITGQSASILHTTTLPSERGIFAVTGYSVTIERGLNVSADVGTYTITVEPALLRKSYELNVNKGVFHINGTNITLRANRYVQGSAGAYSIIGNNAELSNFLNTTLVTANGSLVIITVPASLRRTYRITAARGQITLTRIPATILSTGTPNVEYITSLFAEGGAWEIPIGLRTSLPWWEGDYREFYQRLLLRINIGRTYGDE
jgi:phage gp45-like